MAKTEIDFVVPLAPTLRPVAPARSPNDIAHAMRSDHVLADDDEDHDRDCVHGRSVRPQFHQEDPKRGPNLKSTKHRKPCKR